VALMAAPHQVTRVALMAAPRQVIRVALMAAPRQVTRVALMAAPHQVTQVGVTAAPRQVTQAALMAAPPQVTQAALMAAPPQVTRAALMGALAAAIPAVGTDPQDQMAQTAPIIARMGAAGRATRRLVAAQARLAGLRARMQVRIQMIRAQAVDGLRMAPNSQMP